ncbi:MAG: ribbon-helix-helix domain-containing protein [Acidithiobacillales bacterium]
MAKLKVTFTLDRETVGRLRQASERLAKPQSAVVREAIHDYSERVGRLSERERLRLLRLFDDVVPRIPSRPAAEVDREIAAVRRARQSGGRRGARGTVR